MAGTMLEVGGLMVPGFRPWGERWLCEMLLAMWLVLLAIRTPYSSPSTVLTDSLPTDHPPSQTT